MKNRNVIRTRFGLGFLGIVTCLFLAAGISQSLSGQVAPQRRPLNAARSVGSMSTVTSSDFQSIASGIFSGASLKANSCGGADAVRSTKIVVPSVYNKNENIGRLDRALPENVRQETIREEISYSKNRPVIRDSEIRACLDNLGTHPWQGTIENGKWKIRLQFNSNVFIKTRVMEQENKGNGWKDIFEWRDEITDLNVPDYVYVALCMDVFLTPDVQNGQLGYSTVEVQWFWAEDRGFVWPENALVQDPFKIPYGHPTTKAMILSYKTDIMNVLKQRLTIAFQDSAVRNRLATALTTKVKSGELAGKTIESVSGTGGTVKVTLK